MRSPMDAGAPKVRRRFTTAGARYEIPVLLTGEEKQVLEDFYDVDLHGGELPFTWEDPTSDTSVSFSFGEPPRLEMSNSGLPDERLWEGNLALRMGVRTPVPLIHELGYGEDAVGYGVNVVGY